MSWLTKLFRHEPEPEEHWLVRNKLLPLAADAYTFVSAAWHGDHVTLGEVWSLGIDANVEDSLGRTALVVAASGGDSRLVALLLGFGADPNQADDGGYGDTPLIAAVSSTHDEIVRQLIKANADVNQKRRRYDDTPLAVARKSGASEIVQILLEAGARD